MGAGRLRVAGHVGERLGGDEVRGGLDGGGQPLLRHALERDRHGDAAGEARQRRLQAALGEHGGMDPARELAQLGRRAWPGPRSPRRAARRRARGRPRASPRASRSVSARPTRCCCAPSWRSRSIRRRASSPAATIRARDARSSSSAASRSRDVADVAEEDGRAAALARDRGDRQLDGDLLPVAAHGGDLDPPVEQHGLPAGEVARQAGAVALAQRRAARSGRPSRGRAPRAAVQPNVRSAAGFHSSTRPVASMATMQSSAARQDRAQALAVREQREHRGRRTGGSAYPSRFGGPCRPAM